MQVARMQPTAAGRPVPQQSFWSGAQRQPRPRWTRVCGRVLMDAESRGLVQEDLEALHARLRAAAALMRTFPSSSTTGAHHQEQPSTSGATAEHQGQEPCVGHLGAASPHGRNGSSSSNSSSSHSGSGSSSSHSASSSSVSSSSSHHLNGSGDGVLDSWHAGLSPHHPLPLPSLPATRLHLQPAASAEADPAHTASSAASSDGHGLVSPGLPESWHVSSHLSSETPSPSGSHREEEDAVGTASLIGFGHVATGDGAQQQQQPQEGQQQQQQPRQPQQPQQQQQQQQQQGEGKQHVPGIPQPILVISFVSASLTLASCVFQTLLPIYMVTELRMDMRAMGMFEGLLEAFSYIVRMFSGVVSDMMTSRKSAITLGFAMGAMAKFGMSGATTVGTLFASKAMDRLANGVQAAPRDALISDLAPEASRSACFGFAQSMRKWGSAVGAVLVFALMRASNNDYRLIFTMAATVSLASCVAFVLLVPSHVRPPAPQAPAQPQATPLATAGPVTADGRPPAEAPQQPQREEGRMARLLRDAASMGSAFPRMLLVISLYCLGHVNESLLEARAMEVGFGKAESTLVVATLAAVIFLCAYPLGRLDDKYGPRVTLAIGMAALIAADLVLLASGSHPWAMFASLAFMGVHMGVVQGPLLSIVVGLAPGHLRGTAFGVLYTVLALTSVINNTIIGSLWHAFGAPAAFATSAAMTSATLLALPWLLPPSARGMRKPVLAAA